MDSSEEVDVTVARRIPFMPRSSDARVYARIFTAPEEGKEGARMVQHASSLMYMRHSQDELFMEQFVAAGGIGALARMFEHANPYLRSQAVDAVKRIVKLTAGSPAGEVVWAQAERSPRVQYMFARMFDWHGELRARRRGGRLRLRAAVRGRLRALRDERPHGDLC